MMHSTPSLVIVVLAATFAVAGVGCQSTGATSGETTQPASMGVMNDTCPCAAETINRAVTPAEHKGQKIGFCCPNCATSWNNLSEELKDTYVNEQLRTNMGIINEYCPMMTDHPVDPSSETVEHDGHTIGFCCPSCIKGWDEMPEEEKDAFVAKSLDQR